MQSIFINVEYKPKNQKDWSVVSNNVKPGGNFVVLDLNPATWYNLRVTAHNNAGFSIAEYEFATLTATGGKTLSVWKYLDTLFYWLESYFKFCIIAIVLHLVFRGYGTLKSDLPRESFTRPVCLAGEVDERSLVDEWFLVLSLS